MGAYSLSDFTHAGYARFVASFATTSSKASCGWINMVFYKEGV
jgi:hypothetical protein